MIDDVDRQLKEWVTSNLAGTDVLLGMPPAMVDRPTVYLHLLEMENAVPSRRDGPRPMELTLHYLVMTSAKTPEEAHRLLGELFFAALGDTKFDVDLKPIPVEAWRALGLVPQPAFRVAAPLVRERKVEVPRITKPVQFNVSQATSIDGLVLGPGDVPVSQARVEVPGTANVAYTDRHGRFRFQTLATSPNPKELRVVARGIERIIPDPITADRPVVIRFQPEEN